MDGVVGAQRKCHTSKKAASFENALKIDSHRVLKYYRITKIRIAARELTRVLISDRTGLTAGLRYRFTGPVRPVTGRNRTKPRLNLFEFKSRRSNGTDRYTGRTGRFTGRLGRYTGDVGGAARTVEPAGYTGIPAGWTGIPVSFPPLEK